MGGGWRRIKRSGEDKGSRKRREGYERGGLKVHGRQEKRKEKEVLGDLIMRLSRKCYISNISAKKRTVSWQKKKPNSCFWLDNTYARQGDRQSSEWNK